METKESTEGRSRRLLEQSTFLKWVVRCLLVIGLAAGG